MSEPTELELAVVRKYGELVKQSVEDLVYSHLNKTVRTQLELMIHSATEEATKNIARKLLEIAIKDL